MDTASGTSPPAAHRSSIMARYEACRAPKPLHHIAPSGRVCNVRTLDAQGHSPKTREASPSRRGANDGLTAGPINRLLTIHRAKIAELKSSVVGRVKRGSPP